METNIRQTVDDGSALNVSTMGGGRLGAGVVERLFVSEGRGEITDVASILKKVKTVVLSNRVGTTGVVSTLSL
jgi:hypothetical protein